VALKPDQLQAVRTALRAAKQQQAKALAAAQAAAAEQAKVVTDSTLFRKSVGTVRPVTAPARVPPAHDPPQPLPFQRMQDEQAALKEAFSDDVDVESLLDTDDTLSYRHPRVGPDVPRKLRRGQWALQAEIDLHGMTRDAARTALATFLHEAHLRGARCVRVVHGKGIGSPGRVPVLKSKVRAWLVQHERVLAFVHAPGAQGGHGALLVLLGDA
jgi:DNA-nicking Smr family endonuclease